MTKRTFVLLAIAVGWLLACEEPRPPVPQENEKAALDFVLKDATGHDLNLAAFKGKPLVVNFWATWCGPCKIETPYLEAFWHKYRPQGLTILGIETDSGAAEVRQFAADYQVTYPLAVGVDRKDVLRALGWEGTLPTSVLVRADGTIAGRIIGLQTEEYWDKQIRALF